ncbi:virulence factor Mce family protein, partial [Mycobacterium sp.]|uniref:virulence factor Mce family protein n=1 Tax=Mycobacterium sp. TaxID=1785 RepID=UPI002C4FEDD6
MSTIFDIRSLRLPKVSARAVLVGVLAAVFVIIAVVAGAQLYRKLTTTTVVAYFSETLALYPGDKVQIMGVRVGSIDKIEPAGDRMRVTLHYNNKYRVPAKATASILNPSLVASRTIQLSPPYSGGPVLGDGDVIPIERTQVPVEWDQLRDSINGILRQLGPTPQQPKGPFGDLIESAADNLAGKGTQVNETLDNLSKALTALNEGRGDFVAITRSLAQFVSALYQNDQQFVALNDNLAQFTGWFTKSDHDVADTVTRLDDVLADARKFVNDNRSALTHDVGNLADVTTTLLQPEARDGLETALHVLPTFAGNFNNLYHPLHSSLVGLFAFPNFANPMQFICSAIQAGSRLGYQDSAELCAQYLAPVLDAIKFNYVPAGVNWFNSAAALPKEVAYSEERLRPPPGYKDTTVPGIFSRDTPFSHGNHEPGWVVAPGMQGTQ